MTPIKRIDCMAMTLCIAGPYGLMVIVAENHYRVEVKPCNLNRQLALCFSIVGMLKRHC